MTIQRIEKAGFQRIVGLIETRRRLWESACKHEGISADAKFVVFSKDNPYTNQEFDPHTTIKRLAEAERECPNGHYEKLMGLPNPRCNGHLCDGTGYIVPFASLRVECLNPAFHIVRHDKIEDYPCCQGRNWVPEPDVRVACWQIIEKLWCYKSFRAKLIDYIGSGPPFKAVVIRAAEEWLEGESLALGPSELLYTDVMPKDY